AARLVLATPETGADLYVSAPQYFYSHPGTCTDGKDVCVAVGAGDRILSHRFVMGSAAPVPEAGGPPPDSRLVGDKLIDLGQRAPELLAGFDGGSIRWRSPLSRHFSDGYSTDEGWIFELYPSEGLHVGSVGHPSDRSGPVANVRDWSVVETAAIRAADGSSAWRAPGTSFVCDARIQVRRKEADGSSHVWPVRCRFRGTGRYERATGLATFEGLDVTVEGFDVATGTTTWSVPLGPATVFMEDSRRPTAVTDVEVLVQGATGPVIIDVSNGATRQPALGETFWCGTNHFFEYREGKKLRDGITLNEWRGGTILNRCGAEGSPATATPASIAPSLGATVGGRTVVAEGDALVAYDRR
ncbi:MAG TPA: hypothetical protein VJ653_05300, partial [Acidimicrobiales bacterium]|nr:hypothetical protein [Acidimicrobiales bacterium]